MKWIRDIASTTIVHWVDWFGTIKLLLFSIYHELKAEFNFKKGHWKIGWKKLTCNFFPNHQDKKILHQWSKGKIKNLEHDWQSHPTLTLGQTL